MLDRTTIDDGLGLPTMHDVEHGLYVESAAAREKLVRHCDGMGSKDHIVEAKQRVVGARWLGIEYVDAGTGDPAGGQRGRERLLIDDRPAGGVDEIGARLHHRQPLGI